MAILRQNAAKKAVTERDLILAHCGKGKGGIKSEDLVSANERLLALADQPCS